MKISQKEHYQVSPNASERRESVATGICQLIQLYASELNMHQVFDDTLLEAFNWEYFQSVLAQQLECHSTSAAHEANYAYFESLKATFKDIKKG